MFMIVNLCLKKSYDVSPGNVFTKADVISEEKRKEHFFTAYVLQAKIHRHRFGARFFFCEFEKKC